MHFDTQNSFVARILSVLLVVEFTFNIKDKLYLKNKNEKCVLIPIMTNRYEELMTLYNWYKVDYQSCRYNCLSEHNCSPTI